MPSRCRSVGAVTAINSSLKRTQDEAHFSMKILATRLVFLSIINLMIAWVGLSEGAKTVKIGGWTEVKNGWPLEASNYFLASEEGHHFIKVKHLPEKLNTDLLVTFEYYYSYAKVKPVVQMTPCNENIYLHAQDGEDMSKRWLTHTIQVKRQNCQARNELAYNVLLHDAGDIFAWKLISIESYIEPEPETPTQRPVEPVPRGEIPEGSNSRPSMPENNPTTETLVPEKPVDEPMEEQPTAVKANDNDDKGEPSNVSMNDVDPVTKKADEPTSDTKPNDATNVDDFNGGDKSDGPEPKENTSGDKSDTIPRDDSVPAAHDNELKPVPDVSREKEQQGLRSALQELFGQNIEEQSSSGTKSGEEESSVEKRPKKNRVKRMASTSRDTAGDQPNQTLRKVTCRPSSCDFSIFHMDRFLPFIRGLPMLTADPAASSRKTYLGLKQAKPLRIEIKLDDESVSSVDTCFNFQLYMDADTELHLLMEEKKPAEGKDSAEKDGQAASLTLLESVERKRGQSGAGQYERFERCLSDYMPIYKPSDGSEVNQDKLTFLFKPNKLGPNKLVALVAEPTNRALRTRRLYPVQSFAPDVKYMQDEAQFDTHWTVDRDGLIKAQVKLEHVDIASTSQAPPPEPRKQLVISNIDPTQEYFDLTSRWMQIKDVQLIEQPILFEYHADNTDWADRVEFQFQRAGEPYDKWITQEAYKQSAAQAGSSSATDKKSADHLPNENNLASRIDFPLRLRGLDSEYFRLRMRHRLKVDSRHSEPKSLRVSSLSFADACSYSRARNYCRNSGKCRPTGPATAECLCKQGYSGAFCELVRPCEVMFLDNSMDGRTLCSHLGATCVENLPVFRCAWPNDKYFRCDTVYKPSSLLDPTKVNWMKAPEFDEIDDGNKLGQPIKEPTTPNVSDAVSSPSDALSPQQQLTALKETVTRQAKLVIILGVFLLAIVIFALVLVGSMIGRLRESKSRLKRSQNEVHELSRRFSPSTSSALFGKPRASHPSNQAGGSNGKVGITSYNNASFDAE